MPTEPEKTAGLPVDDVADDARAAFEEVAKAAPETPAADRPTEIVPAAAEKVVTGPEKTEGDRARDERGRFAAKDEITPREPAKPADKVVEAKASDKAIDPAKPIDPQAEKKIETAADAAKPVPPSSWSIPAKADWDKTPPSVQAAVAKREAEVNAGLAELRDYKDLKPYRERAQAAGQTLNQALHAYVGIEELFRRDAVQGFLHVANNLTQLGLRPENFAQIFTTLAHHYGGQVSNAPSAQNGHGGSPELQMPGADPSALHRIIGPFAQRISTLEASLNQTLDRQRSSAASAADQVVERFRADPNYKFFSDVEDSIVQLLESGMVKRTGDHAADLAKAYEAACRLHPEINEQLINGRLAKSEEERKQREQQAVERAKQASKQITGSPQPGTVVTQPKAQGQDDLEADVRAAFRQHAA